MQRRSGVAEDTTTRWRREPGRHRAGPRHRRTGWGPARGGRAFLDAQAANGRTAYGRSCASCHGATLRGGVHGPGLTGPGFLSNWGSQTAAALYEYLRAEMPPGLGGSLPSGTYLSIVAYLLQVNGHAAGTAGAHRGRGGHRGVGG